MIKYYDITSALPTVLRQNWLHVRLVFCLRFENRWHIFSCLSFLQICPCVLFQIFFVILIQIWPVLILNIFSGPRFRLIYAVKPHTEKVTMVSLQTEASLIVTASQDCTLFFFRFATTDRGIDMDPIRCITLEHVAINFEWISLQVLLVHFYEEK